MGVYWYRLGHCVPISLNLFFHGAYNCTRFRELLQLIVPCADGFLFVVDSGGRFSNWIHQGC